MTATHRQADSSTPATIIRPSRGWAPLELRELWKYRELLYFLTWRTVKVRYKQTVLGAAWAIIQPFFTMVVFSLFFGQLARVPSNGVPYPIFSYAALVPWTFFANGLAQASESLVGNANVIKKIYFPRLIIPTASVISGLIDFAMAFVVLLGMMLFYGIVPTVNALWLPLLLTLALVTALGVSLWLSALNVRFRDVRHTIPFIIQLWMFATPIAYPSSLLPEPWRTIYGINPMVGVVEGFRWTLLSSAGLWNRVLLNPATGTVDGFGWEIINGYPAPGPVILISALVALALLVGGAYYFRRMERFFADVV